MQSRTTSIINRFENRHTSHLLLSALTLLLLLTPCAHADESHEPGRPTFVRGIYTNGASTFDTIVSMGFNMVVSGPTRETELIRARQLGLKVIPSWYGDDTAAYDLMRSLDTDPVIMAWTPFDEPDVYHYSADVVSSKISRMRRYGLRKPVYLTVFSPAAYPTYIPSADIFGITPYPIGNNPAEVHMDIVGRYTRRARALAPDKPLLVCIPAFLQRPWQYRAPEPAELHNIVYQALTGYPDGVIFFIWQVQGLDGYIWNLDQHPSMLDEMRKINQELIELDDVLTRSAPDPDALTSPQALYHRVSRLNDSLYWIVANPYHEPVSAMITFPGKAGHATLLHSSAAVLESAAKSRTITLQLGDLGYAALRIELEKGR